MRDNLMIQPCSEVAHVAETTKLLSLLDARVMAIKNLLVCNSDEIQDLLNDNSALLADEPNGEYSVWPGPMGEHQCCKGSAVTARPKKSAT